jgi:hypothetical protein
MNDTAETNMKSTMNAFTEEAITRLSIVMALDGTSQQLGASASASR